MLKKILIGFGLVIVLAVGGVFFLISNLDGIVRTAIENYGSQAVGSQVSVGGVDIRLREGAVTISDFSIANPEGFSDNNLLSFSELSVALDLSNISQESVGIVQISSTDPFVSYERANGTSNLDVISQRLSGDASEEPEAAGAESEMQLVIDDVRIRNIQASVSDSRLPRAVNISLGDIELQGLSGTPAEISRQILRPVMNQLAGSAGQALNTVLTEQLGNIQDQANEALDQAEDTLNDALDETVGEEVRDRLGNLFGN